MNSRIFASRFLIFIFTASFFLPAWASFPRKDSLRFRMQTGVSALPIFDAFNQVPANKISGAAVMGNFGCFVHPHISFGINPYYASITNAYSTWTATTHDEEQQMTTFGLNTYLRGYVLMQKRLSVFMVVSGGFGVMREVTSPINQSTQPPVHKIEMLPVASVFAGPGVSWNLTPAMAIEANMPFAALFFMETSEITRALSTVLPTLGIQFNW